MLNNQVRKLINVLNLGGRKIFYTPVRSKESLVHYEDTILNQRTHTGVSLGASYWAFNPGPKNQSTVDSMSIGDYMFFILRDSEGYEYLDSIAVLAEKDTSIEKSQKFWGDDQYELIIKFDSVFVLKNKLRLSYKRSKLTNILPNVPSNLYHNGYEMFRQWIMNERLTSNKLGPKLIEEDAFVNIIQETCGGTYINDDVPDDASSAPDADTIKTALNDFFKWSASSFSLPSRDPNVTIRGYGANDGNLSLSNKSSSGNHISTSLNKTTQKCIGLTGEQYVYQLLVNKSPALLSSLGIADADDIKDINWSNLGCSQNMENFNDLSLGHDISITLKDRILHLEVKTSFYNSGYYSMTRNELKEMAVYKENYFMVKINHLSKLKDGDTPEIIIENFPIANIIENLNRVKSMEIYL
ncbi:MAG: hypothetical protein ACLSH8_15560 [Zhenhengia sp.]|jgi:hypothetical protein|uniref:hypothetical protein n=1 Tax=Zhenhengia sp. TaxID=2944208 RepID=UPI00290CB9A2|nr:DUF3883 domain-containing protein [Clostridiales bacterium]MDU6974904.1 DUF3883 domain-containing protein [Clostridiales bacterium]